MEQNHTNLFPGDTKVENTQVCPKVNPQKLDNYFAQIKKSVNKRWETCTRSYGLFIDGNPDEILTYLTACYKVYTDEIDRQIVELRHKAQTTGLLIYENLIANLEKRRYGFQYFINTDPKRPGIIYYAAKGTSIEEVREGHIVGYTFRPASFIQHGSTQC